MTYQENFEAQHYLTLCRLSGLITILNSWFRVGVVYRFVMF